MEPIESGVGPMSGRDRRSLRSSLRWAVRASVRRGLPLGVAGVLVAAFPSAAATTGPRVAETVYGFSFSLPVTWHQVPLNGGDINSILNQATKQVPSLKSVLDTQVQQAVAKGIKVYAIGPISAATFPSLNIAIESSSGIPTGRAFLSVADTEAKLGLSETGAKDLKTFDVRLPLGSALEDSYVLPLSSSSTSSISGIQLYIEHQTHVYVVTVSAPTLSAARPVIGLVERSWHWQS
jgi:hypothetical protein